MQNKRTSVLLFVPSLLNLKETLRANGKSQQYINWHLDKYHYFLHLIYVGQLFRYDIGKTNGFSCIKDDYLNNCLGRYRKAIKQDLISWGIVNSDNHYIEGKKSFGYKITPTYDAGGYRQEICINDTFENRLRTKKINSSPMTRPEQHLYDCLKHIYIKYDEAFEYIQNKHDESLTLLRTFNQNRHLYYNCTIRGKDLYSLTDKLALATNEELERNITDKYNADLHAINCIETGAMNFSVDENGRVHTPLTNMSKTLREFIFNQQHPDQPLYNLDISCSQPFFLNILLKAHYGINLPESVEKYINDTSKGILYDRIMEEIGMEPSQRQEFKDLFFGDVYYCGIQRMNEANNPIALAFKKLYPEVFHFIKNQKKGDFKMLSKLMQRAESACIIGEVVKQAQVEGCWVTTIHDSCIVIEDNVQDMYTIMETVFKQEYLLKPNIKQEALSKPEPEQMTTVKLCSPDSAEWTGTLMLQQHSVTIAATPDITSNNNISVVEAGSVAEAPSLGVEKHSTDSVVAAQEPVKRYKYLSDEEMWELQENEEWGDQHAARILASVETISELDFNDYDLPFYRRTYRIEKKLWKQVG